MCDLKSSNIICGGIFGCVCYNSRISYCDEGDQIKQKVLIERKKILSNLIEIECYVLILENLK